MSKAKKLFTNTRVIILLVFLVLSIVAIHPRFIEGVAIRSVGINSSAQIAGITNPKANIAPTSREVITTVGTTPIKTIEDYAKATSNLTADTTLVVETNKNTYRLTVKPKIKTVVLPELENVTVKEIRLINVTVNGTTKAVNQTFENIVLRNKTITEIVGVEDIGLKVFDAPTTNLRKGLDLQGGTRVLLQPERTITSSESELIIDNMKQRLNVYGLSDVVVTEAGDLTGNKYFLVEVAGANEEEVKELLAKQGKFEASIKEAVVFRGGGDITYVCRTPECSGIDPQVGCGQTSDGQYSCRFRFSISLMPEAAQKQADATKDLAVISYDSNGNILPEENQYLNQTIDFYLDNAKVDSLNIGKDLKGKAVTDIQISGGGIGATEPEAANDALKNMKRLQTILITGSLPVKINIVKTDIISPVLGKGFLKNTMLILLIAVIVVGAILGIRYRKLQITLQIMFNMAAELLMMLGIGALIGWNIDLAAIAGIIVAIGTGVNDVVVITDEVLSGGGANEPTGLTWKEKVKRAFFIVMGAYLTIVVAMIPLYFAGAGLLRGFAITTILGATFGILITRPAYASIAEIMLKE